MGRPFYVANVMAADDLETNVATKSVAMVLTYVAQNIPDTAPEGFFFLLSMCSQNLCIVVIRWTWGIYCVGPP